jgi:hypothetical protein
LLDEGTVGGFCLPAGFAQLLPATLPPNCHGIHPTWEQMVIYESQDEDTAVDTQLLRFAGMTADQMCTRIRSLVAVCKCGPTHRCFQGDQATHQLVATSDIDNLTVLGFYGGVTCILYGFDSKDSIFHLQKDLHIDASTSHANELAYANDFRTELRQFDDPDAQDESPNCKAVCVWIKAKAGLATVAANWEPLCRVVYLTCRPIRAGEEITVVSNPSVSP